MLKVRIIPCLLLRNWGIEKSIRFRDNRYIGSPINAARIFNARNVDELIVLDIGATAEGRCARLDVVNQISSECYMPLTIGGGIRGLEDISQLLKAGADRVSINTYAVEKPQFINAAANRFGSQCIVVSIDAKKDNRGTYQVYTHNGQARTDHDPVELAIKMEELGAGEILINSIDRDGTMLGYDIELIRRVADALTIPVIACGGAGKVEDLAQAVNHGHAAAVAAGSLFLYFGRRKTVLINFPEVDELKKCIGRNRIRGSYRVSLER